MKMVGLLCLKRAYSLSSCKAAFTKATTFSSSSSPVHSLPYKTFSPISKPTPQNQVLTKINPSHHHSVPPPLPWRSMPSLSLSQPSLSLAGNYYFHRWLLSFPLLSKQFGYFTMLNAHYFKLSGKTFLEYCRVWTFLRAQVPKPGVELASSFDPLWNRWDESPKESFRDAMGMGEISVDNFRNGRVHTLITSAFSHINPGILICNMIGLATFGVHIEKIFGPAYLLKLYLAGAITGSLFHLLHHSFLALSSKDYQQEQGDQRDASETPGLGANGAVCAVMMFIILLNPRATVYVQLILPVPAMVVGIFLIAQDILRIIEGDSQISGSVHLGGAVVAALEWYRIMKGRRF